MELYRVNIDSDNYFEANSLEIRPGVRIVDIRSLRGHIANDFDAKDVQLKKLIQFYLWTTDNVELINILSREYNEYNWFEAYDESYNSNQAYSKNQLLGIQNNEVDAIASTSQIVNPRSFIPEVRDKSGHLKPSTLYTHLHIGIPRNQKLDLETIDFIPIWYINGKTNDSKCELYCCFEILIHILAKRFVEFKAKLLQLASTDIQLAKANNQTISRYQHLTQLQLIHKIEKLKAKKKGLIEANDDLNAKFDAFRAEANAKLDKMNTKLDTQTQELIQAHTQRDEIQAQNINLQQSLNTANSKLDTATEMISDLKSCIETGIAVAHAKMDAAAKSVNEEFTSFNVTTSSRIETIDIWSIRKLNLAYHRNHIAHEDEEVLDLFCGDAEHPERINHHQYKPEANDEKLNSYSNANALDLADYLKQHASQYPNLRFYTPKRKLIVKLGHRDEALQAIAAYSNSGDGRVEETIERFKQQSFDIVRGTMDVLQAILDKEHATEAEKPQAIARVMNELEAQQQRLQESQKTNAQLFAELRPGKQLFWYNKWYREPRTEADGSVTCPVLKSSNRRYTLSEHDIRYGRFKQV